MRFRQQQDDARRATHHLLALFVLMLLALVVAVNALFIGLWWLIAFGLFGGVFSFGLPPLFIETNTALVLLFVLGGAVVELGRLRQGGGVHVAEWAGGRLLLDPRDLAERRLLNIVDELAIASMLPRPAVYVLEREDLAINAFAAGWSPDDAVIAVTRGALSRLTRDEMQGLVAHEFGHIHQGDLRLNMQLLALVWGLSLVHGYGHALMEADDTGRRSPFGLLVGSVFVAAGSLGWLAGQVLQGAVSRQRELLADACAVQFTRSRDGLGGTLRKIWHQATTREDRLTRVPARLLAAMLLQAPPTWLASHPPLPERVRRVYGRAMEPLPAPVLRLEGLAAEPAAPASGKVPATADLPIAYAAPMSPLPASAPGPSAPGASSAADAVTTVLQATTDDEERTAIDVLSRVNGPGELRAAILAMLLTPNSEREYRAWRDETRGLSTANALRREVKKLGPAVRLPWLETLLKRLARNPMPDRQALMEATRRVMAADGQIRPIDRLHWLLMRQLLGGGTPPAITATAQGDMSEVSLHSMRQVARLTAFLSRMIPGGDGWYMTVMQPWLTGSNLPPCDPPDADGLVTALMDVQELPWMLKPVVARAWVDAALTRKAAGTLVPEAADALRLACRLLDSPLPPDLARHYVETAAS